MISNFLIHIYTKFRQNRPSSFQENQNFRRFSLAFCAMELAPWSLELAPWSLELAPCLINPALIIVESRHFRFKTFFIPVFNVWRIIRKFETGSALYRGEKKYVEIQIRCFPMGDICVYLLM